MALPWLVPHGNQARVARQAADPKILATKEPSPEPAAMRGEEIERYLAREASAARLSVTAELLGTQPGLEDQRRRAEQYILDAYGDTAAGRELSARTSHKSSQEPRS